MSTMMEGSRSNRRSTAKDAHAEMFRKTSVHEVPQELMLSIRSKFSNNYFGLPPYSMQQTPSALAYMCRKPLDLEPDEEDADLESNSEVLIKTERVDTSHRRTHDLSSDHPKHDQYAQRKVASALLIMAKNPLMRKHFLSKGGYEAALKLIADCKTLRSPSSSPLSLPPFPFFPFHASRLDALTLHDFCSVRCLQPRTRRCCTSAASASSKSQCSKRMHTLLSKRAYSTESPIFVKRARSFFASWPPL